VANFPTSLDTLTNPAATDPLNAPAHHTQHSDVNDIVEELEAKVGVGTADALGANAYDVLTADGAGGSLWLPGAQSFVGARYIKTGNQSIADSTDVPVDFSVNSAFEYDTNGTITSGLFYDAGVSTTRFYAPEDGVYSVRACARFSANATGSRQVWFLRTLVSSGSATSQHGRSADHSPDGTIASQILAVADIYMFAGDYVEFYVRQNSGGALNLVGTVAETTDFSIKLNKGVKGDPGAAGSGLSGRANVAADITPTQITSNQDNYSPTGFSTATIIRLSSDASRNITGLAAGTDGDMLILMNVGTNPIVLKHDVTSTAANRFYCPNDEDLTLPKNSFCFAFYDGTSSRWRVADPDFGTPTTQAIGDAAVAGTVSTHKHAMPSRTAVSSDFGWFGDGSDGSATLDGSTAATGCSRSGNNYTATRDLFYTDLTVQSGKTLDMAGFVLHVTGTITNAGTIYRKPVAATGTRTGATGFTAARTGMSGGGGTGPVSSGAGSNGTAATTPALGGAGGAGGAAQGGTGAGGSGGTVSNGGVNVGGYWRSLPDAATGWSTMSAARFNGGGGGGGGGTNGALGNGGGGGAGGGILIIRANTIDNSSGIIAADGGNGSPGSDNVNDGGGGGGGGGGAVLLIYNTFTAGGGTVRAAGGIKGGSPAGGAGSDGSAGTVSYIAMTA